MFFPFPVYKKISFPLYSKNIYVSDIKLFIFVCTKLSVFVYIKLSIFVYIKLSSLLYIKIVLTCLIHIMGYFILFLLLCKAEELFVPLSIIRPISYNYIEQHNQSYKHLFAHIQPRTTISNKGCVQLQKGLKIEIMSLFFVLSTFLHIKENDSKKG